MPEEENLVSDLTVYMDRVEDATAKAAVLPRLLSVPLVLRPMEAARLCLKAKIAKIIGKSLSPVKAAKGEEEGPWLKHFRGSEDEAGENKVDIAAELVLCLIFAAHKNASIGSAQSLVFFLQDEKDNEKKNETARAEALSMPVCASDISDWLRKAPELWNCVRETVRLTSLTIGGVRQVCQDNVNVTPSDGRLCTLSRGETACFAHQIMNTDPTVWGSDASLYRTGRFSESTSVDLHYFAFSKGVHKCPGDRIAMALMQIMLSLFLDRGAELDDGPIPMFCFERATLAQRVDAVPITFSA